MKDNFIEIRNLSFTYPDGTCALQGINLSFEKGSFVGILGANGSGKTTLLKILNGLLKATDGDVYLEGNNIKSINRDVLFSRVCTMFQNPNDQLFSPTVREDIAFGPANMGLKKEEIQRRVECALDGVGMLEFANTAIHNLSFGQKRKACLAGVLAMDPEAMLLDEPTSSLDPMGVNSIMHLLRNLNRGKGKTLIMATHSVDLVPLFIGHVVILNKGRVVLEGTPREVFSDYKMIKHAKLRLPWIGHLFRILKRKDKFDIERLPLTIGEARQELKKFVTTQVLLPQRH